MTAAEQSVLFPVCGPLYQSSALGRETYLDLPTRRPAGGQSPLLLPSCTNVSMCFTQGVCLADFCHFQYSSIKYHSDDIIFRFQPSLEARHLSTTEHIQEASVRAVFTGRIKPVQPPGLSLVFILTGYSKEVFF